MSAEISTEGIPAEVDYERILEGFAAFKVALEGVRKAKDVRGAAETALIESLKSCIGQRFDIVACVDSALTVRRDGSRELARLGGQEYPPREYPHVILEQANHYFGCVDVREFDEDVLKQKLQTMPENQQTLWYGYRIYLRGIHELKPTYGVQEELFDQGSL